MSAPIKTILLFCALMLAALFGASWWVYLEGAQAVRVKADAQITQQTLSLKSEAEGKILSLIEVMESWSRDPVMVRILENDVDRQIDSLLEAKLKQFARLGAITCTSAAGKTIARAAREVGGTGAPIVSAQIFEALRDGRRGLVTEVGTDVTITVPIFWQFDQREFLGVLQAVVSPAGFVPRKASGSAALLTAAGRFESPEVSSNPPPDALEHDLAVTDRSETVQRTATLNFPDEINGPTWKIIVGQPREVLYGPIAVLRRMVLWMTTGTAGVVLLLFLAFSRQQSRLRLRLVEHASRLEQSTVALKQEAGERQCAEAALQAAHDRLETRVAERTAELRESRQRYEVAVEGSSDGLWDWDLATNTVYFSPRAKEMIGFSDDELKNEYSAWEGLIHPDDRERTLQFLTAYLGGAVPAFDVEFRLRCKDGSFKWILSRGVALRDAGGKPFRMAGSHTDITARKAADSEMARLNNELVESSRMAGRAEVATSVLHNVGNVLNSVNLSAGLVVEQLRKSKTASLAKAVQLLRDHKHDLGDYLASDPKGRQLPAFFDALAEQLTQEQGALAKEAHSLQQNIEHIKQIVATQQSFAKVSGARENIAVAELVEAALRMSAGGFHRHRIEVVRKFEGVPPVLVDRHMVLQILVNLISNAKQALDARAEDRRLILRIATGESGRVCVEVTDNGMGVPAENLAKIFGHGFTTKKKGHGFGLHSSANAAKEMGGSLTVRSDGPGTGATFVLELPLTARASHSNLNPRESRTRAIAAAA